MEILPEVRVGVVAGPQKHNYYSTILKECRAHTDYKVIISQTPTTERVSVVTPTKNVCRGCGKNMKPPREYDFAYFGPWGAGCLWVYFPITSAGLLWLALEGGKWSWEPILLVSFLAFYFLVIPVVVLERSAKKHATWKKWAVERAWAKGK